MPAEPASLDGRVAVVTGAASGIGLATAEVLADAGVRVHAVVRSSADGPRLDGRFTIHAVDVTEVPAVEQLIAEIGVEAPIDLLVCAAGTNIPDRRLEHLTDEGWRRLIETNLTGVFTCVRAAMPQLRETRGHVVAVASVSSSWPDGSGPGYQASKAGVLAFVRAASLEEHERGVRFTAVLPGMTNTGLLDKRPGPTTDEARTLALQPEDVAAAILAAVSLPARACLAELTIVPTAIQAVGVDVKR